MEGPPKVKVLAVSVSDRECRGCRSCEIACSFHHSGRFATALSSIKISRSNQTGRTLGRVDSTCDLCSGEKQPLCVKYCSYGALFVSESP